MQLADPLDDALPAIQAMHAVGEIDLWCPLAVPAGHAVSPLVAAY